MFRLPQKKGRTKLPFPEAPYLRIAQISPAAAVFDSAELFPPDRWDDLEAFRPRVLAGAPRDLQQLAGRVALGTVDFGSVDHAIFVVTECGERPLADVSRVMLWQAFGVPVYELFFSPGGALLAGECEAQEGWHIEPGASFWLSRGELIVHEDRRGALPTGLTGHLESEPCPCGRAGTRILEVQPLTLQHGRRLAATA
jgi:hypothetical protein